MLSPGRSAVCGQAARGTMAPLRATAIPRWPVSTAFSSNKAASVATPSADLSLPIRYSAGCRLSPTISRNNKEKLNEDAHESTCNRSPGGRRHDRKCPTVRKPRSAVRSNGRRQFAQRHPGRERNTADRNYRPGHEEGCEEGCQDSADSAEGVRKPQSAVRTRGRRPPRSALIFLRIGGVTNEGAEAPSAASASR